MSGVKGHFRESGRAVTTPVRPAGLWRCRIYLINCEAEPGVNGRAE